MLEKERMQKGMLYKADDLELMNLVHIKNRALEKFNRSNYDEYDLRHEIIANLFKKTGNNFYIQPPFYADYGCNITIGENFYANTGCCFLDVNEIIIGDNVFIAPSVQIYTAGHPIDKDIRNKNLEYGYKVVIGSDVWIGGGTIINPGVKIGSNVVIGSGVVVTKDIPSGVIAAGNPCKVIRKITQEDKDYWVKEEKRYIDSL